MKSAGDLAFVDQASGDKAFATVRYDTDCVAVCLSLAENGDTEVFMTKEEADKLLSLLKLALT